MKNREETNASICFEAIKEYGNKSQLVNAKKVCSMKTNLKPCPFCGKKSKISKQKFNRTDMLYSIDCCDCDLFLESLDESELINRWNTRHDEMTLKKVLLLIPELAIKILALAILAAGVYWIFA